MQEVKKELEQTIKASCEWVQEHMQNKITSPDIVAAIPETLKAISELVNSLENMKIY